MTEIWEPGPDAIDTIEQLATETEFPARAGLSRCGPGVVAATSHREATAAVERADTLLVADRDTLAFAGMVEDPWASMHLGMSIGRLTAVLRRDGRDPLPATEVLLTGLVERTSAPALLVARVDADDAVTLAAAQRSGFEVVDVEITYVADATQDVARPEPASGIDVSISAGPDRPPITERQRHDLLRAAGDSARSHLTADRRIPAVASAAFYRAWTENVLDGRWGDRTAVAWHHGDVIGFFSWMLDDDLVEAHALAVLNRSWTVVSHQGHGALGAMTRATVGGGLVGERWTECETRAANAAMNRALQRTAPASSRQVSVILHRWQ